MSAPFFYIYILVILVRKLFATFLQIFLINTEVFFVTKVRGPNISILPGPTVSQMPLYCRSFLFSEQFATVVFTLSLD